MSDDRLPPAYQLCPRCDGHVIVARVDAHEMVTLDWQISAEGRWEAWFAPGIAGAPQGVWRARERTEDWAVTAARRVHACPGRAGQQMRLDGAA